MKNIIELKNLQKSYYSETLETKVLHGIDLTIKKGEFVAVMGPSGAGKSTLLQILAFLDHHTGGSFLFEDKLVEAYTSDERSHVRNEKMGFIFQAFNLLARTSVFENVKLPLMYSDIPSNKWDSLAKKAIESVGLSHRMEHDPSQLSGGEKQRVAIARSLVCDPPVIFADEPTGNLDSNSGKIVMDVIKKLHEDGRTIILITHETNTAHYAERIINIVDGLVESDKKVIKQNINTNNSLK